MITTDALVTFMIGRHQNVIFKVIKIENDIVIMENLIYKSITEAKIHYLVII